MTDSLSIAIHAFARRVLMSFSVDETLLPKWVNLFPSFRDPPFCVEMFPFWFWLKHMYSVLSALTWRPMLFAAFLSRDSAWAGVFARSTISSVLSVSVFVCVGFRLLLAFVSVKPFSLIKSIDVRSAQSMQNLNRYGASVFPCRTPATMTKKSVSQSSEETLYIYIYIYLPTPSLGQDLTLGQFLSKV